MEIVRIDTGNFVVRERYLGAIEAFIDQPVVKVLKGMRRVGKSVIMPRETASFTDILSISCWSRRNSKT